MAERKIRHVGDVFPDDKQTNEMPAGQTGYKNMFKKKKAPAPPSGLNLPKIGNYQPKILLEPKSPERELPKVPDWNKNNPNVNDRRHSHTGSAGNRKTSIEHKDQFIIGDKNVPITIENTDDVFDDAPIAPPRRKRSAPTIPSKPSGPVTKNPMFGRSLSQRSDEERFGMDFEEQGGDIDFGYGIDNPAFVKRRTESSSSSYAERPLPPRPGEPFIPPPDYDDQEITMDFEENFGNFASNNRNFRRHSEIEGDDFGRYLRDDEDAFLDKPRPWRSQPNINHKLMDKYRAQKPKGKPAKANKKSKQKESDTKRNTIRDFTFSDSKIGWGDRSVKSTSAKGRYIKREKGRLRLDQTENFRGSEAADSYEDFLRHKNPLLDDHSPNSSDSGVELVDDRHMHRQGDRYMNRHTDARTDRPTNRYSDVYLNSQPKQFRSKDADRKPGVWKRLTWRFRKSVEVTKL